MAWLLGLLLLPALLPSQATLAIEPRPGVFDIYNACSEAARPAPDRTDSTRLLEQLVEENGSLRGATLREVSLPEKSLKGIDLSGGRLLKVNFSGAQLSEGRFQGILMCDSDLSGANLRGADLSNARLFQVKLEGADLTGAKLENAQFDSGWLAKTVFQRARMRGFRFFCDLSFVHQFDCGAPGADFRGADLTDSFLYGLADDAPQQFAGARLEGAVVETGAVSSLEGALFEKLILTRDGQGNQQSFLHAEIDFVRRYDPFPLSAPPFVGSLPPSFPCKGNLSAAEKEVCSESGLAQLDLVLASVFRQLEMRRSRARRNEIKAAQRAWLEQRDACGGAPVDRRSCLDKAYWSRIGELIAERSKLFPAEPASAGYFRRWPSERWTPPPEARVPPELRAKVAKIFDYDAGDDFIQIRKVQDGRILADGMSTGANGHLCAIEDAWFSQEADGSFVEAEPDQSLIERTDSGPLTLTIVEPFLLVRGGGAYCGARAGWGVIYRRATPPSSLSHSATSAAAQSRWPILYIIDLTPGSDRRWSRCWDG